MLIIVGLPASSKNGLHRGVRGMARSIVENPINPNRIQRPTCPGCNRRTDVNSPVSWGDALSNFVRIRKKRGDVVAQSSRNRRTDVNSLVSWDALSKFGLVRSRKKQGDVVAQSSGGWVIWIFILSLLGAYWIIGLESHLDQRLDDAYLSRDRLHAEVSRLQLVLDEQEMQIECLRQVAKGGATYSPSEECAAVLGE